jgi:hypothetical protein
MNNEEDKTIDLYTDNQLTETNNWIISMAMRYDVSADDVIRALWLEGKSTVWAKLEQDLKAKHQFFAITPPLVSAKKEASKQ